jgi:hypothetical protein
MANSKLDSFQKADRKELKQMAKAEGVKLENLNDETVIAYKPLGNTVEFALAVKSPDEQKFRVKVGEFHALTRFFEGETVKMAREDFNEMLWNVYSQYGHLGV